MLILTADALLNQFRREVDDLLEGVDSSNPDSENLWSNAECYFYMGEAQSELARLTRSLFHVFTLPITATVATTYLPRWVQHIRYARLLTANRELQERNLNESMRIVQDYGNSTLGPSLFTDTGIPQCYIRDQRSNQLRLYPIPTADDTLELSCSILPRIEIETGTEPLAFTEARDLRLILLYMKKLAYEKQDADTFDPTKALNYKAQFEQGILERASEMENRRRRPGTVSYGGI